MRVYTVSNEKGGVGKTTTAVNVAAVLADRGGRVLLLGLDPQGNASTWYGAGDGGRSVLRVLTELDPIERHILATNTPGVSILPGSKFTAHVDTRLTSEPIKGHPPELRLREALQAVRQSGQFDAVVIDTPPSLGWVVSNAVHAADVLVIPVEAHIMAAVAVARMLETVEGWGLSPAVHIVPVRVDRRNRHSGEVVDELRKRFGDRVTSTEIRENVRVAESWGFQTPVIAYDPRSNGAADYRTLTDELTQTTTEAR